MRLVSSLETQQRWNCFHVFLEFEFSTVQLGAVDARGGPGEPAALTRGRRGAHLRRGGAGRHRRLARRVPGRARSIGRFRYIVSRAER
jgi:hypothetical protein